MEDFAAYVVLLRLRIMFNFKDIVASTSLGLFDV